MAKKVVVIGGGTGNFTILQGLKKHPLELAAIVSMADDGGSTGILRDELGVLPPGDVRQCLVALSNSSDLMRSLMSYRFDNGGLGGHTFGNLLLSALEKVTGSFERAVEEVGRILAINGRVIPVTTNHVRLKMLLNNKVALEGERDIYLSQEIDLGYSSIFLEPTPLANPEAIEVIHEADLIVIGPGGLHTSLIPNFLVQGISDAVRSSKGKKAFVVNLMNRRGQTTGYTSGMYVEEMSRFIGEDLFDFVLVNNQTPPDELMSLYAKEGELVQNDLKGSRIIAADFLGNVATVNNADILQRSLIRHSSSKLSQELYKLVTHL